MTKRSSKSKPAPVQHARCTNCPWSGEARNEVCPLCGSVLAIRNAPVPEVVAEEVQDVS